MTENEGYNKANELIYVRDYDCNKSFGKRWKNSHANTVSVEEVKCIKPKNQFSTSFLVTFNEIKVLSTINILVKQTSQTIVYACRNKYPFCLKCL